MKHELFKAMFIFSYVIAVIKAIINPIYYFLFVIVLDIYGNNSLESNFEFNYILLVLILMSVAHYLMTLLILDTNLTKHKYFHNIIITLLEIKKNQKCQRFMCNLIYLIFIIIYAISVFSLIYLHLHNIQNINMIAVTYGNVIGNILELIMIGLKYVFFKKITYHINVLHNTMIDENVQPNVLYAIVP